MSGVAGVLLMYMNEEEAFWALSTILTDKRFAMHGLYIEGFPKLTRFLAHHDVIISKFIPKLKKHFDQFNLDSILYSLKWFFVIFIERIPFSLCLRVWDIYLLDGERVVTAMAYTILRLHKHKLLKLKDMDLIVQYIQVKIIFILFSQHFNKVVTFNFIHSFLFLFRPNYTRTLATTTTTSSKCSNNRWTSCARRNWICRHQLNRLSFHRNRLVCLSSPTLRRR